MSNSPAPLRIVVVAACPFPFPRGTPVRIQRLSEALARLGHDVHVVTYPLGRGEPGPGVRITRTESIPFASRTAPGPSYGKLLLLDPLLTRKLRAVLRDERTDVVYAHHYEGLLAARLARRRPGPPVVYDAHTTLESELPYSGMLPGRGLKRRLGQRLDRALAPLGDAVVCVNDELRDRVRPWVSAAARWVETVEGGVELDRFSPRAAPPPGSTPAREPTLVYAGNLATYQGIAPLLRAFALVRHRVPAARLRVLTATETSLGRYEGLGRELGVRDAVEVTATSFDELPSRLVQADLALHPRPACAGTPMKLLNYMAAGLPIVSFENSGRILRHEETGWLVPDGDIEAFAHAAAELLDDPERAATLGDRARRLAEERYSWDRAAQRLDELFRPLVAPPSGDE